jgi:flagellar FliL protein
VRGKKGLALLLVGLLVLGGGGAYVALRFLGRPSPEPSSAPKKNGHVVLQAGEITTNLRDPGGRSYIQVDVEIWLSDKKKAKEAEEKKAAVRDVILSVLRSKSFDELSGSGGMEALRKEIGQKLEPLLEAPVEVYFKSFLLQ